MQINGNIEQAVALASGTLDPNTSLLLIRTTNGGGGQRYLSLEVLDEDTLDSLQSEDIAIQTLETNTQIDVLKQGLKEAYEENGGALSIGVIVYSAGKEVEQFSYGDY